MTTPKMAEREAALTMTSRLPGVGPTTIGADKGYDSRGFVEGVRACSVTPHVARKTRYRHIWLRSDGDSVRRRGKQGRG